MSSLGCVISFSRYLVLKLVISALTYTRNNTTNNIRGPAIEKQGSQLDFR